MKFTAPCREITRAMAAAAKAIAGRSVKPVLANLLLAVTDDTVTFTGTDLEMWLSVGVEKPHVEQPGKVLLPPAVAQSLPAVDSAVIETLPDGNVRVKAKDSEMTFNTMDVDEFPSARDVPDVMFRMPAPAFIEAVSRTAWAAPTTDGHLGTKAGFVLQAVLLEPQGYRLFLVATDTHVAAVQDLPLPEDYGKMLSALVPAGMLRRVVSAMPGGGEVVLGWNEQRCGIQCGQVEASIALLAGRFPRWRAAMGEPFKVASDRDGFEVRREDLMSAIRRLAPLVTDMVESYGSLMIDVNKDQLRLSPGKNAIGTGVVEIPLPEDENRKHVTAEVRAKLLLNTLTVLDCESVRLLIRNNMACVTTDDGYVCAVQGMMPDPKKG